MESQAEPFLGGNAPDAVVGVRDGIRMSRSFYIPYIADIGAGQSDLTWQSMVGIGYKPQWGEIALVYCHIDRDFESGNACNSRIIFARTQD